MSENKMENTPSNTTRNIPIDWNRFVKACEEKRTSPSTIVRQFGFSPAAVTRWKNGSVPRDTTLLPLANLLEVPVEYLFGLGPDVIEERKAANFSSTLRRIKVVRVIGASFDSESNEVIGYEPSEKVDSETIKIMAFQCQDAGMTPEICLGDTVLVANAGKSWRPAVNELSTGSLVAFFQESRGVFIRKIIKGQDDKITLITSQDASLEALDEQTALAQNIQIVGKVIECRRKY